jgi:hypothetical protein
MGPQTLVTTKTPARITPLIAAGCARLVPESTPVFVERMPTAGALVNKCTFNVKHFLEEQPGEMVLGWEVCVWEGVLIDFIGHAVVRIDGKLRCVTPSKYGDAKLLFLPDSRLAFDFNDPMTRMPTTQVALSRRPDVRRLVEVESSERAIKIKYPVSSGPILVQSEDALAIQRLAKEKQTLMLKIILATSDHTSECPCGSGKKFRKCHRTNIEHMLRFT